MPLPAVIGAAGAVGGGLLSKALGLGGPTSQQNALLNNTINPSLSQAQSGATNLVGTGQNFLSNASTAFQAPTNYWTSLAGGSRTGALSTLAPQVSQITQADQANANAQAATAPRSGASADIKAGSFYAPQRQITNLLQTVRPQANEQLSNIGAQEGSLGSYTTGTGLNTLTNVANAGGNVLSDLIKQQQLQTQIQSQFGQGLGGLLYQLTKGTSWKNPLGGTNP